MTKHRNKEKWIAAILEAASVEIDEKGYADFSMEAIVRRTGFSKGGIYRFFSNKSEVALQLFIQAYEAQLAFDAEECLNWNLPMDETVFRLFVRYRIPEEGARALDRIWIRLLPEVLNDSRFSEKRAELLSAIREKIGNLCIAIAHRDNIAVPGNFASRLADSFELSAALLEGLSVQTALGGALSHQRVLVQSFISQIIRNLFVEND
jgi:AcrR family transcriptional regulator